MTEDNDAPEAGATRQMPYLPREVQAQISPHLDLSSARCLARTCKALRDVGEAKVWETLDLTSGYDSDEYATSIPLREYTARSRIVNIKLSHALAGLRSHPFRWDCIDSLRIEPYDAGDEAGKAPSRDVDDSDTDSDDDEDEDDDEGVYGIHLPYDTELQVREAALQATLKYSELVEVDFHNVDVYYMSILQRLTILTSARLPLEAYASLGVDTSPSSTVAVSTKMRRYLCRYPCLDIILFYFPEDGLPIVYGTHLQPSLFVDPSQWESLGHRGAIVRQYRPPDDPGVSTGDPTEVFWHVRVLTRVAIHHTGRKFVGAKRHWLDMAYFRGRTVPRDVLQAAYAAHGEDPEFLQGGRSLRMKERAWDILRSWRAAQTEPTGGDEGEDSASGDDEAHEGGDEDEQASDDEEEDGLGDILGYLGE
ncbi:uncharacterized protein MKK02DRAFT_38481 [Dioszegia hungarica]|uniref:F-box domain-containing protein n=1 Tax=Dioszegia hungarica TaxID=4972 RepID=A0AA38H4R5_9TREE|nr:uncharacterized protein MKK02DRAFT_38481 [Dioszegia hungarica]KAI9633820.1 hypothetical protein MKK02DRAFT_38481 [Dioszegia hungarica]